MKRQRAPCPRCDGVGRTAYPTDLPSLVWVAALSAGQWLRAEELVRLAAPGVYVVWRGMGRAALREHHERVSWAWCDAEAGAVPDLPALFAALALAAPGVQGRCWAPQNLVRLLAELLATGAHLIAARPGLVTLAAEAWS